MRLEIMLTNQKEEVNKPQRFDSACPWAENPRL